MISRRALLFGAPAVVAYASLMPIRASILIEPSPSYKWIYGLDEAIGKITAHPLVPRIADRIVRCGTYGEHKEHDFVPPGLVRLKMDELLTAQFDAATHQGPAFDYEAFVASYGRAAS